MKHLFTLVLFATTLLLPTTPTSAQPWPTGPDGSVVLTIQGDRVVKPARMLEHPNHGSFRGIPMIPDTVSGIRWGEILTNADRYRPLLDNNVGGVNFSFNIGGLWGRDPGQEADAELVRQQLWLGAFGIGTLSDRLGTSREIWQNRQCERAYMGESW